MTASKFGYFVAHNLEHPAIKRIINAENYPTYNPKYGSIHSKVADDNLAYHQSHQLVATPKSKGKVCKLDRHNNNYFESFIEPSVVQFEVA